MADDLAAEIAAHVVCDDAFCARGGCCDECGEPWPCLVRRLADAHADCTNLSHAEAARIFVEARQMRAERDALLAAGQHLAAELQHLYMVSKCEQQQRLPKILALLDAWRALAPAAAEGGT